MMAIAASKRRASLSALPDDQRRPLATELARELAARGGHARFTALRWCLALDLAEFDARGELVRLAATSIGQVRDDVVTLERARGLGLWALPVRAALAVRTHRLELGGLVARLG